MAGFLSFSNENAGDLGNPHALAMQDNDLHLPHTPAPAAGVSGESNAYSRQGKLTDAVVAASKLLSSVKSNSSVMGDDLDMAEVKKTDQLVCCMAKAAMEKPEAFGPARLIRLGLFVDEYRRFRRAVAMKEFLDQVVNQRAAEFRQRACIWADEIVGVGRPATAARRVPWKKVALFGGLAVALALGVSTYRTWKNSEG